MTIDQRSAVDKEAGRALIEQTLRRLGVQKQELAAELAISRSALSHKLGPRYPDLFTTDELDRLAEYFDLGRAQREHLLRAYGYADDGPARLAKASSGPASPIAAEGPRPGSNLPTMLSSFVGRTDELRELTAAFERARLLTLTGTGGAGKSRLALEVAAGARDQFPGGVWLVELAGLTDGRQILPLVAAVFNVTEPHGDSLLDAVLAAVAPQHLLLVLDNCEHLIEDCCRLVETLLRAAPHLHVLATSREALDLPGEIVWPLSGLDVGDEHWLPSAGLQRSVSDLAASPDVGEGACVEGASTMPDAVRLFVERARAVRPRILLTADVAPSVQQICRRVEGLPLAIELAAARLNLLSPEQIAAMLDDALYVLTGGGRTAPSRQHTLRATLDWSYGLLDPAERGLLAGLGVFAGSFDLDAAQAVCGASDASADDGRPAAIPRVLRYDMLDRIAALVRKSLVTIDHRAATPRYRLPEPVRQYALEKLDETGETASQRNRLVAWCLALVETAAPRLRGPDQHHRLARLQQDLPSIRAGLEWCSTVQGGVEAGLRLVAALEPLWEAGGYLTEGRTWLATLLTRGERVSPTHRLKALLAAAHLVGAQGDWAGQETYATEALALAEEIGQPAPVAEALHRIASSAFRRGDYAAAIRAANESRALFETAGDRSGLAGVLGLLGLLNGARGDYHAARSLMMQALALRRELGDRRGAAVVLYNLATQAVNVGEYGVAGAYYEQSLAEYRDLNDRLGMPQILVGLAAVDLVRGRLTQARAQLEECLTAAAELGIENLTAVARSFLGRVAHAQGDPAAAAILEQALVEFREQGDRRRAASVLVTLGHIACADGDAIGARARYEEALAIACDIGAGLWVVNALEGMSRAAMLRGDMAQAASLLAEALILPSATDTRPSVATMLERCGTLAALMRQPEVAARLLGAASALREAMGACLPAPDRPWHERAVNLAREGLGSEPYQAVWLAGVAMELERAMALAAEVCRAGAGRG